MSNYQQSSEKAAAPNKVSFSSVKLGETKQGSPTLNLYLGTDKNGVNHMQKLHDLLGELLESGADGCKIGCIVIQGKSYDSGYAYVNPKEQKSENQGQQGGSDQPKKTSFSKGNKPSFGKAAAQSFFKNKRVD